MANWIKNAIKKPGSLRKSLGVKKGKKISAKKLSSAAKKGGKLGKRARLAQTLKGFKKGKKNKKKKVDKLTPGDTFDMGKVNSKVMKAMRIGK